jgi:hypothetical protein
MGIRVVAVDIGSVGSSSKFAWAAFDAVSLLRGLRGGTLPGSLVALLLCTCRRWDRVTAKLIAAIEERGVLSGPDLDDLAESLVSDEVVAVFPLAWTILSRIPGTPALPRHRRCRASG